MSINRVLQQLLKVISLAGFLSLGVAHADFAVLVDTAVLVEANPPLVESGEGEPIPPLPEVGAATNASYVSSGGWAVTGTLFIDATAVVFDFAAVTSVSSATLSLPIEVVYPQNGAAVLEIFFYADNGVVENTDHRWNGPFRHQQPQHPSSNSRTEAWAFTGNGKMGNKRV